MKRKIDNRFEVATIHAMLPVMSIEDKHKKSLWIAVSRVYVDDLCGRYKIRLRIQKRLAQEA